MALLESRLGLSPWDVLNQGLSKHSPLSFGEANIAIGVSVVVVVVLLGAKIGFGTVANAVLVGVFVDLLLHFDVVRDLSHSDLVSRIGLLAGGIALIGVATACYIGAAMGAGPRDSLMIVVWRRTGIRVGIVRAVIEICALMVGIVLGGTFGIGTIAFALLVGPAVESSFFLLERTPLARPPRPAA
ncbi:MAG: hypothetical protein M3R70_08995 [Actinomycetota bacterium]|nr:hypothetical protein [Actinomycetota bacterium]